MARIYGIKKRLEQNHIDEKTIKQIIGNGNLINTITQMEKLLDPDMMHDILDSQACSGGKDFIKRCEKIGKEIADKTLSEKISHINSISPDSEKIVLNAENTLTVVWSFNDKEKYKCLCSAAVNKGVKVSELALENNCFVHCGEQRSWIIGPKWYRGLSQRPANKKTPIEKNLERCRMKNERRSCPLFGIIF